MYILKATEISQGNRGVAGGAQCGTPVQSEFDGIQNTMRSRVEEALEISTLSRVQCRDTFRVQERGIIPRRLRLTNAFLTSDPLVFTDASGEVVELPEDFLVDRLKGIVDLPLANGTYTVVYTSGFTAEAGTKVYQGIPDWMKSIALATMFTWKSSMGITPSKDISHSALTQGMVRELFARVSQRYTRPRVDCTWPLVHETRPVTDPAGEWNQW